MISAIYVRILHHDVMVEFFLRIDELEFYSGILCSKSGSSSTFLKTKQKIKNAVQMGLKRIYLFLFYIYDSLPTCI